MLRLHSLTITSILAFGLASGCQQSTPPATPGAASPTTAATEPHDHDHAPGSEHAHTTSEHPSAGPHHGVLVELGNEEYHAEVTHDDATGAVTVYLLDAGAAKPTTSDAADITINVKHGDHPEQFKLTAHPQDGEPAGQSSRYSLTDKELAEHLDDAAAAPRISVSIGGKPFSGAIPHGDHAGHDHAHDAPK